MNCIITNINVGSQYFQKKTENSVMPIAARKIIVVKSLSFSVIFLHCFLGPTIKKVPNRLKMFPKVNKTHISLSGGAKLFGKKTDHQTTECNTFYKNMHSFGNTLSLGHLAIYLST